MSSRKPSSDIAMSLLSQRSPAARGAETITVSMRSRAGVSMVTPGDGDVHMSPGRVHERCVCRYVVSTYRHGGKDTIGFP